MKKKPTTQPRDGGTTRFCTLRSRGFHMFLTTQFLGAFNDNAFKLVVSLLAVNALADSGQRDTILALAGTLFTLPFILFSTYAGSLADRFSKRRIMIGSKIAEIVVMGLGAGALVLGWVPGLLAVVFLMGAQSAFFGPAKYGCMPELLESGDLPRANGLLQLFTFMAIIAGTAVGGQLSEFLGVSLWTTSFFFAGIALLGTLSSLGIPHMAPADPERPLHCNPLPELKHAFRELREDTSLAQCTAATSFFWFMSVLFQVTLLLHAKEHMALNDPATGWLLASLGLGIGLGSVATGYASRHRIKFGFTPIGAALMAACSLGLVLSGTSFRLTAGVLFCLGLGGGCYGIPLISHLQKASPKNAHGRLMAFRNFANFAAMLLAYPVFWLLKKMGFSTPGIFIFAGILMTIVALVTAKVLAEDLLRGAVRLFLRPFYKLRVTGTANIPATGGALLVSNHISYPDALLLQAACPRTIRFIMARSFFRKRHLNPFVRKVGVIPISATDSPREILRSLRAAGERIAQGEVVGIFAEGALTRTGTLQAFNRGLEIIMKKQTAPIIPACLDGLWGSAYSYSHGRFVSPWRARFPVHVDISFGSPLAADTPAPMVRQVVAELAADLAIRRTSRERVSTRFLQAAKRHPRRGCIADPGQSEISFAGTAIRTLAVSRYLNRICRDQEKVGILLPSTTHSAIANIALTLLGKIPVNLNFTIGGEALERAMATCDMRTVITSRAFLEKIERPADRRFVFLEDFDRTFLKRQALLAATAFYLLPVRLLTALYGRKAARGDEETATILFSSGSTGDPKGVMLSHANLNGNVDALEKVLQLKDDDRVLGNLPLFHSFGLMGGLWCPLTTGHSVVYCPNPLDFAAVGETVEKHRATVILTPPTFLAGIYRRCAVGQLASIRQIITGAEKLSQKLADLFHKKFGILPREGYGTTELSPAAVLNLPDFKDGDLIQTGGHPGSIGRPLPGVAVRVVSPEALDGLPEGVPAPLPNGSEGVLLVKGPNVMTGYLGDPRKTRQVVRSGWYVTGDIATVDDDGFVTIRGRLSRFSKIGGEMVPHERIEEEIQSILGTQAGRKCAVTGIPDEKKGERLVALCLPEVDLDAVYSGLQASNLPKLWVPRRNALVRVEEIPLLGTGKLDLAGIKELALQLA